MWKVSRGHRAENWRSCPALVLPEDSIFQKSRHLMDNLLIFVNEVSNFVSGTRRRNVWNFLTAEWTQCRPTGSHLLSVLGRLVFCRIYILGLRLLSAKPFLYSWLYILLKDKPFSDFSKQSWTLENWDPERYERTGIWVLALKNWLS